MPIVPIEIRVEGLHKSFGEREVLHGIDLEIRSGDIAAIVGSSGSGKTVLLDHLVGLMEPTAGRVLVADHDLPDNPLVDLAEIDEDRLDEIRLHWAVVFQKNALFTGTVYDNIALWLREHTPMSEAEIRRRAVQSLRAVELDERDVLGKERDALSGGMAKRVAIARAIAVEPLVVFYDEPTTGLDPVISGRIHELIWNLHHRNGAAPLGNGTTDTREPSPADDPGEPPEPSKEPEPVEARDRISAAGATRTTLIVTDDKELLRRLQPRVVMLDAGRVCFDGSYQEFEASDVPAARQYLAAMPVLHAKWTG